MSNKDKENKDEIDKDEVNKDEVNKDKAKNHMIIGFIKSLLQFLSFLA